MFSQCVSLSSRRLQHFGENSNIHGLRFIFEKRRPWICRIFWLIALIICGWGLLEILKGTIKTAQDALSFTPDTDRLRWNTAFPSVTICEKYLYHKTLQTINKVFPSFLENYNYNYKKMFADTCFGEIPCNLCSTGCGPEVNCSIDWRKLANEVRQPCSGLIHDCSWQGSPLDCCAHFLPIDSEYGTCYSLNTHQSRLSGSVPILKSNRTTGPGYLSFFIHKDLQVYIHGAEDIPWVKSDIDMSFEASDNIEFLFEVVEMSNDPLVKEMDLEMRKCRFPNEIIPNEFGQAYRVYGYSTCMVICETELMYQKCQCVHHLRDKIYKDKSCNYTGLGCLALFAEERKKMSPAEVKKLCQYCLPSCDEIELTRVFLLEYEQEDEDQDSRVDIKMVHLPNIKYGRNVVRTKLDLVVSIGGLAGLFFGASLLSLVEAIYIIFIRASNVNIDTIE